MNERLISESLNAQLDNNDGQNNGFEPNARYKKLKCEVYANLIYILLVLSEANLDCGIPIQKWLTIFFVYSTLNSLSQMYNEYMRDAP